MSQLIKLTWKSEDGKVIVEDCTLISEDEDRIYIFAGEKVDGVIEMIVESKMVAFEDDDGLFCLPPERIVNIELL